MRRLVAGIRRQILEAEIRLVLRLPKRRASARVVTIQCDQIRRFVRIWLLLIALSGLLFNQSLVTIRIT